MPIAFMWFIFSLDLLWQDETEWPVVAPLPSYGTGRDGPGGRYSSLIFGSNLTDVVVTGNQNF